MISIEELFDNELIEEYKKAVLLSVFKKIIIKSQQDDAYKRKIQNLLKQSYNRKSTVKTIVLNEFELELSDEEASLIDKWFKANQSKQSRRKTIKKEEKCRLLKLQNNKCACCGCDLSSNTVKSHVDHIVPWILVGDELENNYQVLCETCNECKSSRTDYMIAKRLKLI